MPPNIWVVGDVMLDQTYIGSVNRVSPEAPVPVLQVTNVKYSPGGAGNVATNLKALGANVTLLGLVGKDSQAEHLKQSLNTLGVSTKFYSLLSQTITKIRATSTQQLLRLDLESNYTLANEYQESLRNTFANLDNVDLVVFSDYHKGLLGPWTRDWIQELKKNNIPVVVDPKQDWSFYAGADWITPNWIEFQESSGGNLDNQHLELIDKANQLQVKYQISNILLTRSEKGMSCFTAKDHFEMSSQAREVFDVTGAGDTVVAILAWGIIQGWSLRRSVQSANTGAGLAVSKRGVARISLDELQKEMTGEPQILTLGDAKAMATRAHADGRRIVFTNGCFDLLHRGHIHYLQRASQLGDLLWIGLNSDASVQRLKGDDRPINSQADRALLLSNLSFVDAVFVFDEDTPASLLECIRPHLLVKGGDYQLDQVVGREFAEDVRVLDFVDGFSSTQIIQKLKQDI
jgi:D-beta-D-heptose 7-phosphate kinase/D-beta-D-heptose 1-phosphate adenosyltransferase